jgi:hypothetical protein
LSGNRLILEKGNKLQGFSITSGNPSGPSGAAAAIELKAEGTPLKDMVIDCTGITAPSGANTVGGGDKCVHVTSSVSGTVTLENVNIIIPSNQNFVTGILHEGSGTLKVTNGSSVVAVGSGNAKGVVGIYGNTTSGSVEVVGSTVSLSAIHSLRRQCFRCSPLTHSFWKSGKIGNSGKRRNSRNTTRNITKNSNWSLC